MIKKMILLAMLILLPLQTKAITVGLMSDLHAGKAKRRTNIEGQTVYPKKATGMFNSYLKELKRNGTRIVIVAGDNTNKKNAKKKYVKKLRKIWKKRKMKVVFVKGNHDSRKNFKRLTHKKRTRYTKDYGNLRIIVLDSSKHNGVTTGYLGKKQIKFLKRKLKTNRKVIVAMHHPIFNRSNPNEVLPMYQEFKQIIENSGNVIMVVTGHWHREYKTTINGILYWTIPPMTSNGYRIYDQSI